MKKVFIKTFGCQMNEHDSEKMLALLRPEGYELARRSQDADLVVLNTCSIREKSYQKAVSTIGQTRKLGKGKDQVLAVTGCVASHDGPNILKKFPFVDFVIGPDHLAALPRLAQQARGSGGRFPSEMNGQNTGLQMRGSGRERVSLTDFKDLSDYEFPTPIAWNEDRKKVKAYVTIMKGCDNTCSFCIVPFVRGKEVSRASGEIVDEILKLEAEGVSEVMLLGQNVNSYGKALSEKTNFAKLLRLIDEKTNVVRLRYTSPHPKDLSKDLIEEYGRNSKLCPHIHLPVQSGSDRILKKMRRSYTRSVYLRKVEAIRKRVPDIAITADLIVGFPGETDADFEETLSLMRTVDFEASYSFSFSPRPNTEAATMIDDVTPELKKERLARLQDLQSSISWDKNRARVGRRESVLVEDSSDGRLSGRTPQGVMVNFHGDAGLVGAILPVEIQEASPYSLKGVLAPC